MWTLHPAASPALDPTAPGSRCDCLASPSSSRPLPEAACRFLIERIVRIKKEKAKDIQVAFLAIDKKGRTGAFALHSGFSYALRTNSEEKLVAAKSFFK